MALDDAQFQKDLDKEKPYVDISIEKDLKPGEEKSFLKDVAKRNKKHLIELTDEEKDRVAGYICDLYNETLPSHQEICDRIDKNDDVTMMRRESQSDDSDDPNYVTPITAVTLEVVHANIMNVFFTPKDIMRVIPTEPNDVQKVNKLSVFGNWSMVNELNIFDKVDRLFHNSSKNGECPYLVHWVKTYGVEIKREPVYDPNDPSQPLIDPVTNEAVFDEYEEPKLLYNAPMLEVFSRKDYIQPANCLMDKLPPWEMLRIRMTSDEYNRKELQGKFYDGTYKKIMWGKTGSMPSDETNVNSEESMTKMLGANEQEFITFYGNMKVNTVKQGVDPTDMAFSELEDEMIAVVHEPTKTLCSIRKNRFPMKMRPVGLDYMLPDDEGRRKAYGITEVMESVQSCYDALFNQYLQGTVQSNSPSGFFTPFGNMRNEPLQVKSGYLFPVADGAKTQIFQFPQPNQSLMNMMEIVKFWAQMLFGTSDYAAGMESQIDPSAPAKKAEIVLQQGNTRLNLIIKRKNQTLKDIFKRWYLLYRDNMPKNKYMRVAGENENNPWKFEAVSLSDFSLSSIPDFELTGNILNANKTLEFNKKLAIYNMMQASMFFNPKINPNPQVVQANYSLTKWLLDSADDSGGVSRFLPDSPTMMIKTPQEENAMMLQGDEIEPVQNDNHIEHMREHQKLLIDQSIPEQIKKMVLKHIQDHVKMLQAGIVASQAAQQGAPNGQPAGAPRAPQGMVPPTAGGMGGFEGRNPNLPQEQFAGT